MELDNIVFYDDGFIWNFEKLKELIEEGDRSVIHRFLIDHFGFLFKLFQQHARLDAEGGVQDFREAKEDIKNELMRPLSYRQYRIVERSFSRWQEEDELVIWSIWDFLHDDGRIYEKNVMSVAEVSACSLILEEVYVCLARRPSRKRRS